MLHQRIAISLSFIALLVTMPRLVLAFLIGDGILVPQHIEVVLLTATGIGSGVVLTVGNAILAHALAEKSRQKGMLWWVLLLAWVCFLLSAIVVVSPTLVSGLRKSSLITVLPSASAQWFWAITAVAVVEILVGASTTASILETVQHDVQPSGPSVLGRIGNALVRRLEQTLAPEVTTLPVPTPLLVTNSHEPGPTPAITNTQKKQLRQQALAAYIMTAEAFDAQAFADQYQVSPQTVYRDLKELQEKLGQTS